MSNTDRSVYQAWSSLQLSHLGPQTLVTPGLKSADKCAHLEASTEILANSNLINSLNLYFGLTQSFFALIGLVKFIKLCKFSVH